MRWTPAMPRSRAVRTRRVVGAEQAVQRVGGAEHEQVGGAAAALIFGEQGWRAGVAAGAQRVQHQVGQGDHVAEAEIEALAGDRVDAVRGVADQREAGVDVALRVHGGERVEPAAADRADGAEMRAEAAGDLAAEHGVVEADQAVGEVGALGPDDGGDVGRALDADHRQLGEGAGGQEVLERGVAVRPLVRDGADDAALPVGHAW